jgi:TolB protein
MRRFLTKPALVIVAMLLFLGAFISLALSGVFKQGLGQNSSPDPTESPSQVETIAAPAGSEDGADPAATQELSDVAVAPTGRIAYVTPEGSVATMSPDGRQRRILTEEGPRFQFPAWSSSGESVAAIGSNAGGAGVYVLRDEPGALNTQELYFSREQAPFYLYWSPDDQHIAFLASHPTEILGFHAVPVEPEYEERLLATGIPFYWDWTADAQHLFIHAGYAGPAARLEFLDITGSEPGRSIARPGFFQAPGISPTGRYLAYAEEVNEEASQLVIADTETSDTQEERHPGQIAFEWSPSEDLLAVISAEDGAGHFYGPLRLVDARSTEIRLLTRETIIAFFWSPDGRTIAAFSVHGGNNDLNVRLPGPRTLRDVSPKAPGAGPSPRAKSLQQLQIPPLKLMFIDVESGLTRSLRPFEPSHVFATQFLPFFDQYALSHRLWSPGSEAVVIPMVIDDQDRVVVVPAGGQELQSLEEGDMPSWSHQ